MVVGGFGLSGGLRRIGRPKLGVGRRRLVGRLGAFGASSLFSRRWRVLWRSLVAYRRVLRLSARQSIGRFAASVSWPFLFAVCRSGVASPCIPFCFRRL